MAEDGVFFFFFFFGVLFFFQNDQNSLEGRGQWHPFSIPAESIPGYKSGSNLVIPAQICDELLRGQTKFPLILSQNGQNDIEGQGQ